VLAFVYTTCLPICISPKSFHIISFFTVSMGIVGVEERANRPKGLDVRTGEGGGSRSVVEGSFGFTRGEGGGWAGRVGGLSSVGEVDDVGETGTFVVVVAGMRKGFSLMYPSSIWVARFSSQGFNTDPS
jgi:hypothetical protein